MIHCYFGDYSSHKNEVKMLDRFLSQLQIDWSDSDTWIYVVFNAIWNGEEIDLVCFTEHAIIVADLKNYSGQLTGGENGAWEINTGQDTLEVKGGGQINPYVQIRKNKFAVINWIKQNQFFTESKVDFVSAVLIFNEIESCQIDVSPKVQRWLYISDIPHCSSTLSKLSHVNINLDEQEVIALITKMKLQPHQWQLNTITDIRFDPFTHAPQHTRKYTKIYSEQTKAQHSNLKAPSKWKVVYLPLFLTFFLAYAAGYMFVKKEMGIFDVMRWFTDTPLTLDKFQQLAATDETQQQHYLEEDSSPLIPFEIGADYQDITQQIKNFDSVSSATYSDKIIQVPASLDYQSSLKHTYLFFSANNELVGVREVFDNRRRDLDDRYAQFKMLKKQLKQRGFKYIGGEEPFVGTQVANFKDRKTGMYHQVFQPHLSFEINTLTMTESFYKNYALAATKNMRGGI